MHICNIAPIPHLSDLIGEEETHHLVLADMVLESADLTSFYRERLSRGDFVIMDSMAFENSHGTPLTDMIEAAKRLRPSEIVLPDDMESGERTVRLARIAMSEFRFLGFTPQFMGVPHGRTLRKYMQTALALSRIPGVTTLGIQEEVEELYSVSRREVCLQVAETTRKELHMLGVTETLDEWRDPVVRELVRTSDTSKLVVFGLGGHRVEPTTCPMPVYPGRAKFGGRTGYLNYRHGEDVTDMDGIKLARYNIDTWRNFVAGEETASV